MFSFLIHSFQNYFKEILAIRYGSYANKLTINKVRPYCFRKLYRFLTLQKNHIFIVYSRLGAYAIFQHVTFSTFLYVPTIGVVFVCLYIIILVKIRSKRIARTQMQRNEQDKEKQAVIQLVLIIFAFLLGYIPFTGQFMISLLVYRL